MTEDGMDYGHFCSWNLNNSYSGCCKPKLTRQSRLNRREMYPARNWPKKRKNWPPIFRNEPGLSGARHGREKSVLEAFGDPEAPPRQLIAQNSYNWPDTADVW